MRHVEDIAAAVVSVAQIILGIAVAVWGIWCVVVGFAGGSFPVPWEWHTEGSILEGLLWLVVGLPLAETIVLQAVHWLVLLLALPFAAVAQRRNNENKQSASSLPG